MNPSAEKASVQYLPGGTVKAIREGRIDIVGRESDHSVQATYREGKGVIPKRVWNVAAHNAETSGSVLLSKFLPDRRFPFPKSLYAVEDALSFFVSDKPDAIVLDFFAGSGTTIHAVMRMNRRDGARRHCIAITNNEVGPEEQDLLRKKGKRPGDDAWDVAGICNHITRPRVRAAILGRTPQGESIVGDYRYGDEFPMADGLDENAEYFNLSYETSLTVATNHAFERVAPLLWLRAGSRGRRIEKLPEGWDVADTYGVIADLDHLGDFLDAISDKPDVAIAFVITDDERQFTSVCTSMPDHVEPVRLYESYLRNFQIDAARSSR